MTAADHDDLIVEFAHRWAHFDGGTAEDIFVTFGLTPATYFTRLQELIRADPTLFSADLAVALDALCVRKLAQRTPPAATLM